MFSGFLTQVNETYYDQLTFKLIQLLVYKVQDLTQVQASSKSKHEHLVWMKKFMKVHLGLISMESLHDGSTPKMSIAVQSLAEKIAFEYKDVLRLNQCNFQNGEDVGESKQDSAFKIKIQTKAKPVTKFQANLEVRRSQSLERYNNESRVESLNSELPKSLQNPQRDKKSQKIVSYKEHPNLIHQTPSPRDTAPSSQKNLQIERQNQPLKMPKRQLRKSQPGLIFNSQKTASLFFAQQKSFPDEKLKQKIRQNPSQLQDYRNNKESSIDSSQSNSNFQSQMMQTGERWVRQAESGKWIKKQATSVEQLQVDRSSLYNENPDTILEKLSHQKDNKTPSSLEKPFQKINYTEQMTLSQFNVMQQQQKFMNLKLKHRNQQPVGQDYFTPIVRNLKSSLEVNRKEPQQKPSDSSSYIERVDISDDSAFQMGMQTGQSFYKVTKINQTKRNGQSPLSISKERQIYKKDSAHMASDEY